MFACRADIRSARERGGFVGSEEVGGGNRMERLNFDWVLSESRSLEQRFEELEKAGEEQELPLSLVVGWALWVKDNCFFELEVRRALGEKGKSMFFSRTIDVDEAVFLAWRRSRERLDIANKDSGRIGELVRDELARLCVRECEFEFTKWDGTGTLLAGDRVRSWFVGEGSPFENVVLKAGRCGGCYPEDLVEAGSLVRERGRRGSRVKTTFCGECIMSPRMERALWGDERLRNAELRRQYPSVPPTYRRRRRFRRGPDVVVGDRSWFVEVGELDVLTGNENEGWRPELPVVVRMELEVMARAVSWMAGEQDECIVREIWRSDGKDCAEFSVKAYELVKFSPWRVPWKDEKERRSLQRMEELERNLAYMRSYGK